MPFAPPWSGLERLLFAAICTATLFFALVTPPFQAPDENQHYMKALSLTEGKLLTEQRGAAIGAELPRAALAIHAEDFPTDVPPRPRQFHAEQLARSAAADPARPGRAFADFPNVASYAPSLYAPGAAGLAVGGVVGLPALGSFYLGRLVNALAGLALLLAALRLLPFGRNALLATALLPTLIGAVAISSAVFAMQPCRAMAASPTSNWPRPWACPPPPVLAGYRSWRPPASFSNGRPCWTPANWAWT